MVYSFLHLKWIKSYFSSFFHIYEILHFSFSQEKLCRNAQDDIRGRMKMGMETETLYIFS